MSMANWTIGKRMAFGFTAVMVVAIGLGVFAYSRLVVIQKSAQDTINEIPGLQSILELATTAEANSALTSQHILTEGVEEQAALVQKINALSEQSDKALKSYEPTIVDTEDRALFEAIQMERKNVREAGDATLALSRAHKPGEASAALKSRFLPAMEKYVAAIDAEIKMNVKQTKGFSETITHAVDAGQWGIVIGLLIADRRERRARGSHHHVHRQGPARVAQRAQRRGGAGGLGGRPGGDLGAVAVAGRDRAGGVARGDVGVDGRDGVDDAARTPRTRRRRRRWSPACRGR